MDPRTDPAPSLESLFRRWRDADDSEALAEVLARTEGELIAVARRQARDDSAAWDLVQESWLTVLREARRWDENQRLMPWIVGILQIEARRARRDAARTPDPRRLDLPVAPPADAEAPAAEVRTLVECAVAQLPVLYRDVTSMHLLQNLSHTEIAARTGREPATVRVQVFRGLAQLRKLVPASLSLGAALAVLAPGSEAARLAPVLDGAARLGLGAASGAAAAATAKGTVASASTATTGGILAGAGIAWLLGGATALLLAAGAWFVTREGGSEAQLATSVVSTSALGDAARDRSPALEVLRPSADSSSNTSARSASAVAATPLSVPIPAARGVRLVGRVTGFALLQFAAPTVTVRADGLQPLVFPIEAGERFELDLSAWFEPGARSPREFVVEYDHPNALPESRPVLLDATALASVRAAADVGAHARHEIDVRFDLRAPTVRVHGIATWARDEQSGAFPPGIAALFEVDAAGTPAPDPAEGVEIQGDGTFWLRAPRAGAHVLVVTPMVGDVRPATIAIDLAPGEDRDLGRIELASAARISGTVLLDPAQSTAVVEPIVRWRPIGESRLVSVHGTVLRWDAGRFERAGSQARIQPDGSFAIGGLPPGPCQIESVWRERASSAIVEGRVDWQDAMTIHAPATGIVVAGPGAITVVTVRAEGSALERALVEYRPAGSALVLTRSDASGHARLVATRPGLLRVRLAGHATYEREFGGALEPSITVDLLPEQDQGRVTLAGPGLDWKGATCALALASTVDADELAALRRGELPKEITLQRASVGLDGRLSDPVRAGRWWITVRGSRDDPDGPLAHARPFVALVDVALGAETRVDVALELAARIRFAPVAARAGAADVEFELVGPDGRTVPLAITSLVLRGDARQGRVATTDRLPFGANATSALLEPGSYLLNARIGAQTVSRALVLAAGRTSVVEIDALRAQ